MDLEEYTKEKRERRLKRRYPIICPRCGGNMFHVFGHKNITPGSAHIDIPEYICTICGELENE